MEEFEQEQNIVSSVRELDWETVPDQVISDHNKQTFLSKCRGKVETDLYLDEQSAFQENVPSSKIVSKSFTMVTHLHLKILLREWIITGVTSKFL